MKKMAPGKNNIGSYSMITSLCRGAWLFALAIALAWPATPANAQKPPTDLTELNIEEILSLRINRQISNVGPRAIALSTPSSTAIATARTISNYPTSWADHQPPPTKKDLLIPI